MNDKFFNREELIAALNKKNNVEIKPRKKKTFRLNKMLEEKGVVDFTKQERINRFIETHNLTDKYPARDLYNWHTILTESCTQGKDNFVKKYGVDLDEYEATLSEFFEATQYEHGKEILEMIRKRMEKQEERKRKERNILEHFKKHLKK